MKALLLIISMSLLPVFISAQTMLSDKTAYYPRLIRLQHSEDIKGRLIVSFDNGNKGTFYESKDSGATWSFISSITESTPPRNCCSELYEVPINQKNVKSGNLFWATSVGTDRTQRTNCSIRIYKSTDHGRSWNFFSTAVTGKTGLWEPSFSIDDKGRLLMFFSSEEYKSEGYNQVIAHRVSTDGGLNWSKDVMDVGMNDSRLRPGMPTVVKLQNNTYIMCYEVCGMNCDTYIRFSKNGYDWGNPSDLGTRVESNEGNHFSHAPTISRSEDGRLLVIGQVLNKNSDNTIAENNGKVFMVNENNGRGLWTEMFAPVVSQSDGTNPCQNYSSQLMPYADGKKVLEFALKRINGSCRLFYNSSELISK
jgi:hypothetical protein